MQKYILSGALLFCFFISHVLIGQESQIKIEFKESDNVEFTCLLKEDGTNYHTIELMGIKNENDTIKQDSKVFLKIEHFNSTSKDIELLDSIIYFPMETFVNQDTIRRQVKFKSYNDTVSFSKVFKIFAYIKNAIDTTELSIILNTENRHQFSLSFNEIESDEVGRIFLLQNSEIPIYRRKKIGKREELREEVSKAHEKYKLSGRNKRFMRRYEKSKSTIHAESVKVIIENGQISLLVVKVAGKCEFYKNKGPISLTNYDNKNNYVLHYAGTNSELINSYIRTTDFIDYIPSSSRLYFPSHCEFVLDKKINYEDLKLEGSPNSFFDARAYTDTKGLSGEENGLIQTEINAQFMANSNNLGNSYMSFFKYVRMGVSWSKFDSKFDTLEIQTFNNRADSDLLKILRQANTSFEIETDLLRGSRVADAFLTIGHRIYHTPISDLDSGRFQRVFTPSFYGTIGGTIFATPRISARFKFPVNVAYNNDQPFIDYERNWNLYLSPEVEIAIRLKKPDSKDETKRSFVFARIKYFDMPYYRGNNYWQIQTGVEIPISNLFDD
ncbi:MAG: hypothetical protein GQ574_26635 [Crocinitomix sp.]|nr:hypothetical protein [Crocinitomix sp.]